MEKIKVITAEQAAALVRKAESGVMGAISKHMNSLTNNSKFIDVEKAEKYITWFDTGENKTLVSIQLERDGKIFVTNNEGETDRLEPSELSTFDLIAILEAIEETIIIK